MAETITFNEIWSPAYGFEDSYEVSTQGRVRSLERKRKNNHIYKSQFIKTRGEIWCPAMETAACSSSPCEWAKTPW